MRFTETGRDIRLLSGEALFKVHPDPARPFRVSTPDAMIQAHNARGDVGFDQCMRYPASRSITTYQNSRASKKLRTGTRSFSPCANWSLSLMKIPITP